MKRINVILMLFFAFIIITFVPQKINAKSINDWNANDYSWLQNRSYVLFQDTQSGTYVIYYTQDTATGKEVGVTSCYDNFIIAGFYIGSGAETFSRTKLYKRTSIDLETWSGYSADWHNLIPWYKYITSRDPVLLWIDTDGDYTLNGYIPGAQFFQQTVTANKVKYVMPIDGFTDNARVFTFYVQSISPYYDDYTTYVDIYRNGVKIEKRDYNDITQPAGGLYYELLSTHTEIVKIDSLNYLKMNFSFSMPMEVGANEITTSINIMEIDYSDNAIISVTRLEGFIDENGDGLDDRTGRPDGNYLPSDVGTGSALMTLLENKIGTSMLTNSFTAISNMSTVMPPAPTFTIPLADLFDTCVSRFYSGANPFTGKDYTYNFAYLEQMNFMGMSVLNYFRMIISALLVWSTFMYVWEKVIPDKAVS